MIIPRRRKRDSFLPWAQLAADGVVIYALLWVCFWLRFTSGYFKSTLGVPDYAIYAKAFIFITFTLLFLVRYYGLYKPGRLLTFAAEAVNVFKAIAVGIVVLMAATFFIRDFTFSRTFLLLAGIVIAFGVSLARFLIGILVMHVDRRRGSMRNILVVGCDENSRKLVTFYKNNPRLSTRIIGFLDDRLEKGTDVESVPVLGKTEELPEYVRWRREVHEVVLALQDLPHEKVLQILCECEKRLVTFRWVADVLGLITSRMGVSYLGGVSLLSFTDSPLADWENRFLKRTVDIGLSLAALIFLGPLFLIIALLIKTGSRGPVFYTQQRIGEDGRRFVLYKFRTMRANAEKETGPVWAAEKDPRRTRIGSFLRENNLDELPQLWNVLRGDMSLVGPRPERPFFVSQFKEDIPRYMARHTVRSGLTGWAQVNGLRGNTSIEERTKFDLYYIENWSLFLDVKILFMTFFSRRNAY